MRIAALFLVVILCVAASADCACARDLGVPAVGVADIDVGEPAAQGRLARRTLPALCSLDTGSRQSDTTGFGASPVLAQATSAGAYDVSGVSPVVQAPRKRWKAMVAFYLWATDISGTSYADGVATDIDIEFSDLFDKLEVALMGYAEYRYDRWSIALDASYVSLKETVTGPLGRVPLSFGLDQTIVDLRLGYQVLCRQTGSDSWGRCCYPRMLSLDAVVGARYWNLEQDNELVLPGGGVVSRSTSNDWVDPYVGARFRWQFAKRWSVSLYGDVGGFGIGDGSDLTWQLQTMLRFQITRGFFVGLGYRHLDIDRVEGSGATANGIDAAYSGPLLGIGFQF